MVLGVGGSGKTEISLNLATAWARSLDAVHVVDFDLVTPYFRTQDLRDEMERAGVRAIVPPVRHGGIDAPYVPPEVPHIIARRDARAIFDVGGDEAGATTVRQFAGELATAGARAYVVVNTRRPETANAESIADSTRRLATAAGLGVAGLISNAHLREETDWDLCLNGLALVRRAAEVLDVPVVLLTHPGTLAARADVGPGEPPALPLHLHVALPWVA